MTVKELKEYLYGIPEDTEVKIFNPFGEGLNEVGIFAEKIDKPYLFVGNNLHLLPERTDLIRYSYYTQMDVKMFTDLLTVLYGDEYEIEEHGDNFILAPKVKGEEPLFVYTDGYTCELEKVTSYFGRDVNLTLVEENGFRKIVIFAEA